MYSNEGNSERWELGVALGVLGSILINLGNNIQSLGLKNLRYKTVAPLVTKKKSSEGQAKQRSWRDLFRSSRTAPIIESDEEESEESVVIAKADRKSWESKTWILGTFIFYSGSLLNFASYAFAAQSLLASLESVQFVTTLIFGRFMLKARITREMLAGTCLIVVGTVVAVQFSSKEAMDFDISEIKNLYRNPAYLIYVAIMGGLLVVLHLAFRRMDKLKKEGNPVKYSDTIMPLVYSVWSALFGTQSVVQAKVIAELVSVHVSGKENVFTSWFTYVTALFWLSTVAVWLKRLNNALEKFDPLFIIPLLQCCFIFFAIVSGGIFFQEFNNFDTKQWAGFWSGIFLMFVGMASLMPKSTPSTEAEENNILRRLLALLLARGGIGSRTIDRQPSSSCPTPCHSVVLNDEENDRTRRISQLSELNGEGNDAAVDQSEGLHKHVEGRTPLFSRDNRNLFNVAMDAVREFVKDPAQLLFADPSTRYFSDAMVSATKEEEERERRRSVLKTLLGLIIESPPSSNGLYTDEMMKLIRDLHLETSDFPMDYDKSTWGNRAISQEQLHHQLLTDLALGESDTTKSLCDSLDLMEKFEIQSEDDQLSA